METLSSRLRAVTQIAPEHPAIVGQGNTLSYRELLQEIQNLATHLARVGIGPGSRVGLALPNGAGFVTSFFAVVHVGGVVVPLNPVLQEAEMSAIMADARLSVVLTEQTLRERCARALGAAAGLETDRVIIPEDLDCLDDTAWTAELAEPQSQALYLYSSGTTGQPKCVARNHFNLLYETDCLIAALQLSPSDCVLGVAPFTHINGLMRSMVASMLAGATLVPLAQFERRTVGRVIQEHAITIFIGVPFMFAMLAETRWPQPIDFSSLRFCVSSSAPLRPDTSIRFHERYGLYLRQLYGTTETGTIALNLSRQPERSLDAVGTPLQGVTLDVFGEDFQVMPAGEVGDIGIQSPAAACEYLNAPEHTKMAFRDGYFFPGDIGRKDSEGLIYLLGRKSLFINRGGYKVNPYEIEELIDGHPKVQEVVVIGVETAYGDEKIKAVIVPAESFEEHEIVDYCRGKVADFKIPSIVEFRPALPKSATGKVLRKFL